MNDPCLDPPGGRERHQLRAYFEGTRADPASRKPRVGSVQSTVNRPFDCTDLKGVSVSNDAAMLGKDRRRDVRVETLRLELIEHRRRASREPVVEKALAEGLEVALHGVGRCAAVVSPARTLCDERLLDLTGDLHPAGGRVFRRERSVIEESSVEVISKEEAVFGIGAQGMVELGGRVVVAPVGRGAVGRDRGLHAVLVVPAEKLEACAGCGAIAADVVVPRPVARRGVHIVDHVVDQVGHIEVIAASPVGCAVGQIPLHRLVSCIAGEVSVACAEVVGVVLNEGQELGVGLTIAVDDLLVILERILIIFFSAKVAGHEGGVRALDGIVDTPVNSVQIEVDPDPVGTGAAQGELGPPVPFVAHELTRAIP